MVTTGIRVPTTHGAPPMISGSARCGPPADRSAVVALINRTMGLGGQPSPARPSAAARSPAVGWVVTWPVLRVDQIRPEFAVEVVEQGFTWGWGFRWPEIPVSLVEDGYPVRVNDSQGTPVLGAFVTVTADQSSDGVDTAELLGQQLQAGPGDNHPPADAGFGEVPRGKGFRGLVHRIRCRLG